MKGWVMTKATMLDLRIDQAPEARHTRPQTRNDRCKKSALPGQTT